MAVFDRYLRDTSKLYEQATGASSDELGGLTKQAAIPGYHGTAGGGTINKKLRKDDPLFSKEIGVISALDSKMEFTQSPMELDREVNDGYFKEVGLDFDSLTDLVGKTFVDKGFVSTSYKPNLNKDSVYSYFGGTPMFLILKVPSGTPAMLTDNAEHEITLGRGLRYKISALRVSADSKPTLILEVVN